MTVMKREREKGEVNGIKIFKDLCRDYLDSSKEGKVALSQRIVKPSRADMSNFEDKLRGWEEDVEDLRRCLWFLDWAMHQRLSVSGSPCFSSAPSTISSRP